MIIRAFFSSPYASHIVSREAAITDAMLGLLRIRHVIRPVMGLEDLARATRHSVWSPLIEGAIIKADTPEWTERAARDWCLECLARCNTLIKADDIPRRPGVASFCDVEESWARQHGLRIISAVDIQHGGVDL